MSRQVIWEAQAIDQAAGFLGDDPGGVREMLDAVARLADEPVPAGRSPTGHLTGGGCASAATGSCTTSPPRGYRFGISAAAGLEAKGEGIAQTDHLELGGRAGLINASIGSRTLSMR